MADDLSRQGKGYRTHEIVRFTDEVHAPHDEALAAAFEAPEKEGIPAIMVSPSEGRMLELLCRIASVRRAVEVGTLTGYSAIRIARGMPADGKLWSLELDPRHAEVARARIAGAGLADRVEIMTGNAHESLVQLQDRGPFDAVFLDADKAGYLEYGRWAAKNLRAGGLLIADNSYLFGRLCDQDPTAESMRSFHRETSEYFDSVCVPTPDGMVVGIRTEKAHRIS